jgi:1,4-dihydroxy-2-naphthoate octaprenyltransferase
MKTKKIIIILNIFAFLASLIWLIIEQTWEPLISTIGLIATLISLLYSNDDNKSTMKQKGGKKSTNYQAGGDINF